MKQKHNIKAGGIILLILLGFAFEHSYPFIAIFLEIVAIGLVFWKINKQIKLDK